MRRINILAPVALTIILAACSDTPAPVSKAVIEKSIREVEAAMVKTMAAKDASAFVSNYATDAVLMTPGMASMKGGDAIRAGAAAMLADPNLKLEFASDRVEVADSGEMAATRGNYTMTATDAATKKPKTDKGSYVTVFRKQKDGAWKAVLDINTSEVSPAAPPAPKAAGKKKGKKH